MSKAAAGVSVWLSLAALTLGGGLAPAAGAAANAQTVDRALSADATTQLAQAEEPKRRRGRFRRPGSRDEPKPEEPSAPTAKEPADASLPQDEVAETPSTDDDGTAEAAPGLRRPDTGASDDRRAPVPEAIEYEKAAVPDRWSSVEDLGVNERWWDPYNQNTLKGDRPIFGTQDWFVNASAIFDSVFESRAVPTPLGVQLTKGPGNNDIEGHDDQIAVNETLIGSISLVKGDTVFRPPDFEFRIAGALNMNYTRVKNQGVLYADPQRGRVRTDYHFGFTELFADAHLLNWNDRYDFLSLRVGLQGFISDFRGFLYADNNLGARLFGNFANNRLQYNLAYFRRVEKDTNSGLPTIFDMREDDIVFANLYYQDFPIPGFTLQATTVYNRNRETSDHYDENRFKARPSPAGDQRPHDYDVVYFGLNGDGHFDRLNVTFSAYLATGHDDHSFIAQREQTIHAFFLAGEFSYDFDWWRLKAFGMFASGDDDPFDSYAKGFDAIFDNANFAGAETSFWHRQAVPLIFGGGVALVGRDSLLPSLRTSKAEGQSNFINPGLRLVGIGADFDLLPELRLVTNVSYLRFDDTAVIEQLRQQGSIHEEIGWDLSAGLVYRPLMTNNIILRASGAVLFPGEGLEDLYDKTSGDPFYSILLAATLAY